MSRTTAYLSRLLAPAMLGALAIAGDPGSDFIGPPAPQPRRVFSEDNPYNTFITFPGLQPGKLDGITRNQRHLVGGPDTATWIVTGGLAVAWAALAETNNVHTIEGVGDTLQLAVPVTAAVSTWIGGDVQGFTQFAYSIGTNTLFVGVMKDVAQKWRPNDASNQSFPSGHAASTFGGASFVNRRYGARWGIPMYMLAGYTAYSRVFAQKHFEDDVLAGASFAMIFNWAYVTPVDRGVELNPVIYENRIGVGLNFVGTGRDPYRAAARDPKPKSQPTWRYQFDFGSSKTTKNTVQAPRGQGDVFDFSNFQETSNPTTNARGQIEWTPRGGPHEVDFVIAPMAQRDFAEFSQPVTFNGTSFPANEALRTRYAFYDYKLRYRYHFGTPRNLRLYAGAGMAYQDVTATMGSDTDYAEARDITWMPFVHLFAAIDFAKHWSIEADADGMSLSDDDYLDTSGMLRYRLNDSWDFGAGIRYIVKRFDRSDFVNDFEQNRIQFSVGYSM